jgi:GTP-binding protein YchF
MEFGIVGLELSGKTTLFSLLTGHAPAASTGKKEAHVGMAHVPDVRLDRLTAMFQPKKRTPATVRFVDVPGIARGGGQSLNLSELRTMDGLLAVVRGFESEAVPHPDGTIDAARDLDLLETEMIMADHTVAENRLEKLVKEMAKKKAPELLVEKEGLERGKAALDAGTPLREVAFSPEELRALRGFTFLTLKPLLAVLNVGEEASSDLPGALARSGLLRWEGKPHVRVTCVCAPLEEEVSRLDPAEQADFLAGLGLPDRALDRVLHAAYELLGLISFLTVGEDECRAWSIASGTHAVKAAGVIHSDIERGFIRAEIVPWQELLDAGSIAACRTRALLRQEGRDYVVKDGDVVNFKFNV